MSLFQNISCCCLTLSQQYPVLLVDLFQNISCCCLTLQTQLLQSIKLISKHLMLLFNPQGPLSLRFPKEFQNISCCCLTNLRIDICNYFIEFQNISCCCLTIHTINFAKAVCSFQNISCCCLTKPLPTSPKIMPNFKTSHVVV